MGELTDDDSPLTLSLGQFKTFTEHLNELTAQDSSLAKSLAHLEDLSNQLTKNDNITVTLANFRASSEELKVALDRLGPDLEATLSNAKTSPAPCARSHGASSGRRPRSIRRRKPPRFPCAGRQEVRH